MYRKIQNPSSNCRSWALAISFEVKLLQSYNVILLFLPCAQGSFHFFFHVFSSSNNLCARVQLEAEIPKITQWASSCLWGFEPVFPFLDHHSNLYTAPTLTGLCLVYSIHYLLRLRSYQVLNTLISFFPKHVFISFIQTKWVILRCSCMSGK